MTMITNIIIILIISIVIVFIISTYQILSRRLTSASKLQANVCVIISIVNFIIIAIHVAITMMLLLPLLLQPHICSGPDKAASPALSLQPWPLLSSTGQPAHPLPPLPVSSSDGAQPGLDAAFDMERL